MSVPSDPRFKKQEYEAVISKLFGSAMADWMFKKPMELPVPGPYECDSKERCFKIRKMEGPPYSETPKTFIMKINNRRYRGYPMARAMGLRGRKLTYPPEEGYDENKRIALKIIFGKRASMEVKLL